MKIFCVGRNYAAHALELKNEVPGEPVIFMKPPTALLKSPADFYYPDFSTDVHYEAEIVLKVARQGKKIQEKFAHKYFDEITVGIDFTARDLQQNLKQKGLPWELAKGFDGSAITGKFIPLDKSGEGKISFSLAKNGNTVQKGDTSLLLFPFSKIISFISRYFTLQQGDLIFTGTPEGVGPVNINDFLEGFIEGEKLLEVMIK